MTDPAEIRAEGRRLLALEADADSDGSRANVAGALYAHLLLHADVLLADPAPVGLTEDERQRLMDGMEIAWTIIANAGQGDWGMETDEWREAAERWRDEHWHPAIDRLSPAPVDDRERADHYEAIVLKDWAEDRERVPEGWRVEWIARLTHVDQPQEEWEYDPILVPVSPSVDPEEG